MNIIHWQHGTALDHPVCHWLPLTEPEVVLS